MQELFMGLMSGTSTDGIDAALVDFSEPIPRLLQTHYTAYPPALREQILNLCQEHPHEIQRLGELDIILGQAFAQAALDLLTKMPTPVTVKAIGSHGQTIRHMPALPHPFTLQIGDPNTIAARTGITTIADFRRKDMALGGQGAPLVPAFHQTFFASKTQNRIIVNIGGIANITLLAKGDTRSTLGFDTGPGNVLLDAWNYYHHHTHHDQNGEWAAQGKLLPDLLAQLLQDAYFKLSAPKSTGREYFNLAWLNNQLTTFTQPLAPVDVQTTLAYLTAQTILQAIPASFSHGEILVCGGGAHNAFLMQCLTQLAATDFTVATTEKYGIHPDWVEAVAFAWLARQTLNHQPGNLPQVTGATKAAILGGIYYA